MTEERGRKRRKWGKLPEKVTRRSSLKYIVSTTYEKRKKTKTKQKSTEKTRHKSRFIRRGGFLFFFFLVFFTRREKTVQRIFYLPRFDELIYEYIIIIRSIRYNCIIYICENHEKLNYLYTTNINHGDIKYLWNVPFIPRPHVKKILGKSLNFFSFG